MKQLSPVEFQLLVLLVDMEVSGREAAAVFKTHTGRSISYGTLYTTYRRLREAGLVAIRVQDKDGRVRFFRATDKGKKARESARKHYAELALFGAPEWLKGLIYGRSRI